jgi:hypothetical protein
MFSDHIFLFSTFKEKEGQNFGFHKCTFFIFNECFYVFCLILLQNCRLGRRCLVQILASANDMVVEKIRRKCGKVGEGNLAKKISENFRFKCKTSGKVIHQSVIEEKLELLNSKHEVNLALLELLTGLQSFLQLPLELLIICDKMLYLQELGYTPRLRRIFDPSISPRCFVISCKKY